MEEGDMKSAHGIRVHLYLAEGPAYFTFQTLRTMPWNCWENSGAQTNNALFNQPYLLSAEPGIVVFLYFLSLFMFDAAKIQKRNGFRPVFQRFSTTLL